MAYSYFDYEGTDTTIQTDILCVSTEHMYAYKVLSEEKSNVTLSDVALAATFTKNNAGVLCELGTAPSTKIRVIRSTPYDVLMHDFSNGAQFNADSVDEVYVQLLYLCQEIVEGKLIIDSSGIFSGTSAGGLSQNELQKQLDASKADGYSTGEAAGKAAGYSEGEAAGKAAGTAAGDAAGYTRGYSEGEAAGKAAGKADGEAAGYARGFSAAAPKKDTDVVWILRLSTATGSINEVVLYTDKDPKAGMGLASYTDGHLVGYTYPTYAYNSYFPATISDKSGAPVFLGWEKVTFGDVRNSQAAKAP